MSQRYYFDYAATTPVDPEVAAEMDPFFTDKFGNPSSIYQEGQKAEQAVLQARENVQNLINADDRREIIFTGGGTESDNLAIKGVAMAMKDKGRHIITSQIEHHAVLHTCEFMEKHLDYDVTYLPVDENGFVRVEDLKDAIRSDTVLISIMLANNEIGTIQPIPELTAVAKEEGIYFHTDAVQAPGQIEVDVNELGVDLLSLSSHKLNGPKGVGALYVRKGTKLIPQMNGGAQERKRRGGTENVPGIVGFGKAAELALERLPEKRARLTKYRDKIINTIMSNMSKVILNGPKDDRRLPNNINFCFRYVEGESILLNLDFLGIAASSGSACTSGSLDPSHVLLALGLSHEVAHGSLRISMGYSTTEEEVDYLLEKIPGVIQRIRDMSPLYEGE
ncbi:MAG: cysteine desulfurase NifS [Bacillota bacterium]